MASYLERDWTLKFGCRHKPLYAGPSCEERKTMKSLEEMPQAHPTGLRLLKAAVTIASMASSSAWIEAEVKGEGESL